MKALVTILVVSTLLAACVNKSPARIDIAKSTAIVLDDSPTPLGATLVTESGQVLTTPALTYSVSPANVLTVANDGSMRCRSSGDASVIVAGGGHSATVSVLCRLVRSIDVPATVRLVMGKRFDNVPISVRDEAGRALTDVPLTATTTTAGIARYANGALTPIAIGQTAVTVAAGKATATIQVEVVQLVESKTLALADGSAEVFTLQQGTYDVDIRVQTTNGSKYGVTVSWVGADCPPATESQEQHIHCAVKETASMTVLNPSAFGLGPAATGFLNVYRTAQ
jgi:hypothetical protein